MWAGCSCAKTAFFLNLLIKTSLPAKLERESPRPISSKIMHGQLQTNRKREEIKKSCVSLHLVCLKGQVYDIKPMQKACKINLDFLYEHWYLRSFLAALLDKISWQNPFNVANGDIFQAKRWMMKITKQVTNCLGYFTELCKQGTDCLGYCTEICQQITDCSGYCTEFCKQVTWQFRILL